MNLYLLTRTDHGGYDTYDSAVVCAESEEHARDTHPDGRGRISEREEPNPNYGTWVAPETVNVELIGHAAPLLEAGVVCSSFNAG